jgi:hypothetical protein
MYESMYEEEIQHHGNQQIQSTGIPKKWTHLEFIVELVYDLVFPGKTQLHLQSIKDSDDRSICSTRTLSSFESVVDKAQLDEEVDLNCDSGRDDYLNKMKPTKMTKKAMLTNKYWPRRFDGLRHSSLPVSGRHCKYCLYQYDNDFNEAQKDAFELMKWNRANVRQ